MKAPYRWLVTILVLVAALILLFVLVPQIILPFVVAAAILGVGGGFLYMVLVLLHWAHFGEWEWDIF